MSDIQHTDTTKRSLVRSAIDKAAETISQNKAVAAALASLLVLAGAVSIEDAGTWTNIVVAVTTVIGAVL